MLDQFKEMFEGHQGEFASTAGIELEICPIFNEVVQKAAVVELVNEYFTIFLL
jgi:hypothetical protein